MKEKHNREGFWYEGEGSLLPKPKEASKPWKGQSKFVAALRDLEFTLQPTAYKGSSRCRICKEQNGSEEFQYKTWIWPSGFLHYVEKHNVRPSLAFQEFILQETLK
jgi:hypothetical protein